jgi:hypothetical protein
MEYITTQEAIDAETKDVETSDTELFGPKVRYVFSRPLV